MANVSADVLARSCERGEIPVTLVRLGPRLRFVKVAEFTAWLSASRHADVNLFE
jgi:hypothetical protein